jgi:hypothetical protein
MNWMTRLATGITGADTTAGTTGNAGAASGSANATTVRAPAAAATSPTSPENSALRPAFDRKTAAFGAQVKAAQQESASLAQDFKACLMEVGLANAKGAPTFHGYGTGKPMTLTLRKPLPDDRLDLTVCLNVSGHDFKDANDKPFPDAKDRILARAKDNKYVIQVTRPDGTVEKMTGIAARGALSTAQDISIRGMKPGLTVVEAWPEGSAGVGGYREGRRLEITYTPPRGAVDTFG